MFDGENRLELGDPTTAEEDGTWTISVDPQDENLGEGTFTLIAEVDSGEEGETEDTNTIEITIDCPPVLTGPEGDVTECEENFDVTVSGATGDDTVTLFVIVDDSRVPIGGEPTFADGIWTFSVDPNDSNLGNGQFTFIVCSATK